MDIKLIISDIDGVWTDGGMYYSEEGTESRKFNTSDSVGVLMAFEANIDIMVVSGEDVQCVRNRVEKLNIKYYYAGIKDKLNFVERIAMKKNLDLQQIAFIGDEINDHKLLRKVGFSGCPQSSPWYTKGIVDYIVPTKGGNGAFRDFVIEVLARNGGVEELLSQLSGGTIK